MRKSKSNPAKYTRNYRKVSQRHMTGYGDDSNNSSGTNKQNADEKEQRRLEFVLKNAEQTWKRGLDQLNNDVDESLLVGGKRNRDAQTQHIAVNEQDNKDDMFSLLSPELREQFIGMENLAILPSGNKKKTKKKELPPLTPAEIKAAKALYKNTQRKLAQLEQRKKQKEMRSDLYKELEENTLLAPTPAAEKNTDAGGMNNNSTGNNKITPQEAQSLLLKSSELGKKLSKKQKLKTIRHKEALGLKLSEEEMDLLYVKYDAPEEDSFPIESGGDLNSGKLSCDNEIANESNSGGKKKKSKKKKRKSVSLENGDYNACGAEIQFSEKNPVVDVAVKKAKLDIISEQSVADAAREGKESNHTTNENGTTASSCSEDVVTSTTTSLTKLSSKSYAQMMFAGLSSLKTKTDSKNVELANEKAHKQQEAKAEAIRLEEEERKRNKVYVPSETIKVSTMHRVGALVNGNGGDVKKQVVRTINRPVDIEDGRYDLPVSAMEFEIIDAVRSNDCTILCGETGSGKSTQVPQFLYEAGFSVPKTGQSKEEPDFDQHLLIGVTQPRRVAAVSTAKRVCYEMGHGNGQTICSARGSKGGNIGNLVAYQTRYETAGLGNSTHIKFMTDGILLQEIQSDLLLRKYGAIVIDEAHERNLNTDVLLGLLSVALPLRQKAADEGSLSPLKLIIMSATLRIEDFTENTRLFPKGEDGVIRQPAVVKVPGRTFPVSIHHSKVTELDKYEKAAFEKTCKIHYKLPAGGILVFLTGKQEVLRMVNKLKQKLEPRDKKCASKVCQAKGDVFEECAMRSDALDGFRDMDDEEVDGDLFQSEANDGDDFEGIEKDEDVMVQPGSQGDDKRPKNVKILPLYSMLSADEQAKVFAPVPDDTRLIVIATNIAETSITIPEISYVVDSGRQKCRNYHSTTGVSSYDVMWISKAAADQRAGRAGRTGPGHCYRLYSSSVYSRYLDEFALPEVLTRPLEDIVLAMKAMNVSSVARFPFPTQPDKNQIASAVRLLANLGCIDLSTSEIDGGDGKITTLGAAVSKLPLGVRYGKMLLVSAQANVLDYGIAMVAVLSESNPFIYHSEEVNKNNEGGGKLDEVFEDLDQVDRNNSIEKKKKDKRALKNKWMHDGGDVLSAMMAAGAYAYAGRGGASKNVSRRQFCEENGLHLVVMERIAKMRLHLCKLAKMRLPNAEGVAADTGTYSSSMSPPKRAQEYLLRQAIASGLLDNIARRSLVSIPSDIIGTSRSAYMCGNMALREPLFIDNNSTVHSKLPEWVCFDSVVRKKRKDGTTAVTMQRVTPIDPEFLASLCHGSNLMTLGSPLATPLPRYNKDSDRIECAVETKFGSHSWQIPPLYLDMYEMLQNEDHTTVKKQSPAVVKDDSFRWFARLLLEGKILPELSDLLPLLNEEPNIITHRKPHKKVTLLVSDLRSNGVDSARALQKHWAEKDDKFLFRRLKLWVKDDCVGSAKAMWINAVECNMDVWKQQSKESK